MGMLKTFALWRSKRFHNENKIHKERPIRLSLWWVYFALRARWPLVQIQSGESRENCPFQRAVLSWLAFAELFRQMYSEISPLRFKEIRNLVDDYEAGRLELTEVSEPVV